MNAEERLYLDGAEDPILFYKSSNPYGCFSNFSRHDVTLPNPWTGLPLSYPTGEHRYQAMKADNETDHDYVLFNDDPGGAQRRGRQVSLRKGWGERQGDLCWFVMTEVVTAKALQHLRVAEELIATGDSWIYED